MKYLLILTLIGKIGTAGMGGVTAYPVFSEPKCHEIGQRWLDNVLSSQSGYLDRSFYSCEIITD